ncbi:MAG: molybdopterin cofactor-binding domain-containing protein, partial [Lautropia sp.]
MNKPIDHGVAIALRVNGKSRQVAFDPRGRLSDLLRDGLGLTGTKIGCHAGDCGACTVLLDGAQVCACLVGAGQCSGRDVVTVESLADGDRLSALQQAFIDHGAAQCGICTPGMLMAATALLAESDAAGAAQAGGGPKPLSEAQVLDALGGVLCRCTGYRKIVEAVLAVANAGGTAAGEATAGRDPADPVGARLPRLDGRSKVSGLEQFGADRYPEGALWMRAIRSPHARARFELGDLAEFRARHPGLAAVVTAADVPNNRFAIFPELRDQPVLADAEVRFRGEAVLLLVGEQDAVMSVDAASLPIRWQVLPALEESAAALAAAVADPADALHARWPDNVLCRGRVNAGDVDQAMLHAAADARHACLEVRTRHVEHAYIEPEAGYAVWEGERLHIFVCTQTPYLDRDEVASVMGIAPERVRIEPSAIGGGFGGKLDMSVQPLLAVASRKTGQAVRTVWDRPESMLSTTKRHPAQMKARAVCSAQGDLIAYDFEGDFNTGAYSSWGPTVANRVPIHASGPYRVPHVRALTRAVITNNAIAGAFRGFGVPQSTVIGEALMDELAGACGLDPLEFRYRNALRAGDTTPTGQRLDASVGLRACLARLRPSWQDSSSRARSFNATASAAGSPLRRGAGIACMWYGIGN